MNAFIKVFAVHEIELWSIRSNRWVVLLFGVLLSAFGPITAYATQWDQQKVVAIAGQVNTMLGEIVSDPGASIEQDATLQRKKHNAALVDLKNLHEYMAKLAAALNQGRGLPQTAALYKKVATLRKSVRDYAQDSTVSEGVRDKAQATGALLDQLDAFYQLR